MISKWLSHHLGLPDTCLTILSGCLRCLWGLRRLGAQNAGWCLRLPNQRNINLGPKTFSQKGSNKRLFEVQEMFHPQTVMGTCICARGRIKKTYPGQLNSKGCLCSLCLPNQTWATRWKDNLQNCLYTRHCIITYGWAATEKPLVSPHLTTGHDCQQARNSGIGPVPYTVYHRYTRCDLVDEKTNRHKERLTCDV